MARLREVVRDRIDDLRGGEAYSLFYRIDTKWGCRSIFLDSAFFINPADISDLEYILKVATCTVVVHKSDFESEESITLENCEAYVKADADYSGEQFSRFIEAHRPHVMDRPADLPVDIPFSITPADPDNPPDLLAYDGSMTPEDFEATQRDAEAVHCCPAPRPEIDIWKDPIEGVDVSASNEALDAERDTTLYGAGENLSEAIYDAKLTFHEIARARKDDIAFFVIAAIFVLIAAFAGSMMGQCGSNQSLSENPSAQVSSSTVSEKITSWQREG